MGVRIGDAVSSYPVTSPDEPENSVTGKAGDTLDAIAARFNIPVNGLLAVNPHIADPTFIVAGLTIKLPPQTGTNAPPPGADSVKDQEAPPDPRAGSVQDLDKTAAQLKMNQQLAQELVRKAGVAGLDEVETKKLAKFLNMLSPSEFRRQTALFEDALHSGDRVRAMRAFIDVAPLQRAYPNRISEEVERSLVMGVGTSRIENSKGDLKGMAGILGEDQALQAAHAMIKMPDSEYKKISDLLHLAGTGAGPNGSAETERALILKAVAARQSNLAEPDWYQQARMANGLPTDATEQIAGFAQAIRGKDRGDLVEKSTVTDLNSPEGSHALQQRFTTSCAPTSAQITEAESDPVTALRLHSEAIHSTTATGDIAREQRIVLNLEGGMAVPRGGTGGTGIQPGQFADALNRIAARTTHRTYTAQAVGDSKEARGIAMDRMEGLLRKHIDVPIAVYWEGGGGHALVATEVRGNKPDRAFLITDPWNGKTGWVRESDIASGKTDFFAGKGHLGYIFPSEMKPTTH